jgi:lipoyl-dependent peroxiredoxin
MPARKAEATWQGTLNEGSGSMKLGSGAYEGPYTFKSRFEDGEGTNPEELIGAAEAGCFTMALSARLGRQGFTVNKVHTVAEVSMEKVGEAFSITRIVLNCEGHVEGISEADFLTNAEEAKKTCIISRALNPSIEMVLNAKLG